MSHLSFDETITVKIFFLNRDPVIKEIKKGELLSLVKRAKQKEGFSGYTVVKK